MSHPIDLSHLPEENRERLRSLFLRTGRSVDAKTDYLSFRKRMMQWEIAMTLTWVTANTEQTTTYRIYTDATG